MASLPVRATVADDDLQRSRLTVFFRVLLAIPHLIWLGIWASGALLLAPIMWIATLVRGRAPDGLHEFYVLFLRYSVHVLAYLYLAANPFPGFLGRQGTYPVDIEVDPPEEQNRWTVGFRFFLAVPALMMAGALGAGFASGGARSFSFNIGVLAAAGPPAWVASPPPRPAPRGAPRGVGHAPPFQGQAHPDPVLPPPRPPPHNPPRCP